MGTISVVNVKDSQYGAVGDNITDDTIAIQKALDYIFDEVSNDLSNNRGGGNIFSTRDI